MAKRSLSRPLPPRPTNAELEILRVLWARGPCTVRAVRESFDRAEPIGYTTVLKLLQIMTEKGLVRRDESLRSHVAPHAPPPHRQGRRAAQGAGGGGRERGGRVGAARRRVAAPAGHWARGPARPPPHGARDAGPRGPRAGAAVDRGRMVRRRGDPLDPARLRLAGHAEPEHRGHATGPPSLSRRTRPPGGAPPGHTARAGARVGGGPGPRGQRVAPAGGPLPGH